MSRRRKKTWLKSAGASKTVQRAKKKFMWGEGSAEEWQFNPPILKVNIKTGLAVWYSRLFR